MKHTTITRSRNVHHLRAHPDPRWLAREQQVAEQAARHGLEHLLAPALGLLDLRAPLGLGRKQRRAGLTSSRKRAIRRDPWTFCPSSSSAGTVNPSKPASRTSSGCSPGISLTSRCGMRLWATIAAPAAAEFEIAMT